MSICHFSAENKGVFLVDEVLVEGPRDDATGALASDARQQAAKVPNCTICLVDFYKCVHKTTVVLGWVLIVVLKEDSSADQVEWVSDHAAGSVGREGRQCRHDRLITSSIRGVSLVEAKCYCKGLFKRVVNGVEDAREGHITNEGNSQSREQTTCSLLLHNLSKCICCARVLLEANNFEASFNDNKWVRDYRLERATAGTG